MKNAIVNLMTGKRLLLADIQQQWPHLFTGNGWFKSKSEAETLAKNYNCQARSKYATHPRPNGRNLMAWMLWLEKQATQPAKVACVVMNKTMFDVWAEQREELYRTSGYNRLTRWDSKFEKVQQIWSVFLTDYDNYTPDAGYESQMNEVTDA